MSFSNEVEIKGGMYTFMSVRLRTRDLDIIDTRLAEKVQQAPAFFSNTPVVLDLASLDTVEADGDDNFDTARVLDIIRRHRLLPIVVRVFNKSSPLAKSIALPLIEAGAKRQDNAADNGRDGANTRGDTEVPQPGHSSESSSDSSSRPDSYEGVHERATASGSGDPTGEAMLAPAEIEYVIKAPTLIDRPVRSGQQIYARDTDLIIMGQVGAGAEVVADNNIHVYGPLRGRALCGVSGNTRTRIFCQSLEAELVSVAGNFRLLEHIPENLRGKPAQIRLDNDRLSIEPL